MLSTDEKPYIEEEVNTHTPQTPESKAALKAELEEADSAAKPSAALEVDAEEMELLADLRKATDKDIDKTAGSSTPGSTTSPASTTVTDPARPRTNVQYQNHELVAKLAVAALNVAMGMILQVISDDWSEDAEKKYTLSPTRKAEILEPLTLVLEQSKSKYNPVVILIITVLVSYIPMFISAFRTRKEKSKLAKQKKKVLNKVGEEVADEEDAKQELKEELNNIGKVKEVVKTVEIFKMTAGQQKRLKEIKAKRGKRSNDDIQFIKEMGLTGLV